MSHRELSAAKRAVLVLLAKLLNRFAPLAAAYPHAVTGFVMALVVMAIAVAVAGLAELAYALVGWLPSR
jgi:hypothetical protein